MDTKLCGLSAVILCVLSGIVTANKEDDCGIEISMKCRISNSKQTCPDEKKVLDCFDETVEEFNCAENVPKTMSKLMNKKRKNYATKCKCTAKALQENCYTEEFAKAVHEKDKEGLCRLSDPVFDCLDEEITKCNDKDVKNTMQQQVSTLRKGITECNSTAGSTNSAGHGHGVVIGLASSILLLFSTTVMVLV